LEEGGVTVGFQRFAAHPLTRNLHRKRLRYGLFSGVIIVFPQDTSPLSIIMRKMVDNRDF